MHIRREVLIPSAVGVASFGIGAAAGYFIAVARFSKRVNDVVEAMNELMVEGEKIDPDQLTHDEAVDPYVSQTPKEYLDSAIQHIDTAQSSGFVIAEEDFIRATIFPEATDDWVMEDELALREALDAGEPYVIHREEFDEEEPGYSQVTLTYYAGDNILCDDKDYPLENIGRIVGDTLLRFGAGSGDPNVVYVRNDRLNAEYEILLHRGSYAIEVLGEELEIALSAEKKATPKFRPVD